MWFGFYMGSNVQEISDQLKNDGSNSTLPSRCWTRLPAAFSAVPWSNCWAATPPSRAHRASSSRIGPIACGTGTMTATIKPAHPTVDVAGLDPDPKACARQTQSHA